MGSEELLRRENGELRAREARYREGLQRQLDLSKRLREYAAHLRGSLRERARSADQVFAEVAQVSAEALQVGRVSVWLFDAQRQVLKCAHLFVAGQGEKITSEIAVSDVQGYVRALTTDLLAVEDVTTDPRLLELRSYCSVRGIGALLDVPIVVGGDVLGVICHEYVGGARPWHDAEIDFAANLGSIVALAIEAERRQEAQDRAREVDARYRHLVETVPVVIYSIDATTLKLVYVSPTIQALLGITAEEILRRGLDAWRDAILPEDRPLLRERLRIRTVGVIDPELVYRVRRADGSVIWIRDLCTLVRDVTGTPLAVQGTLEDITAERAAEQRRLEAERRYRQLVEHVDLLGVVLDSTGTIVAVNDAFVRAVGIPREEALGQQLIGRFVPAEDRMRAYTTFAGALATRSAPPRFECSLSPADGTRRSVVWSNTLLFDDAGEVIGTASLGLDLTERIRLESELAQQRKFESLGRMAASVAHDFNNVLTVISLSIAHGGKSGEITTSLKYARELVSSLLSYARRDPIAVQDVEVDRAIHELAPVLATAIGKDLRLDVALHGGTRKVRIAPTELRQLVVNIVTNAGEWTRDHGHTVRIATTVIVRESPPSKSIEIKISDDGRGMDEATRARAFDPFFTTKPVGEGTGIGLATCQSIVSRAGGTIDVASTVGTGTTFTIVFPVATTGTAELAVQRTPSCGPVDLQRVLLVEDSQTIGGLIAGVLVDAGYDVVHVSTVSAALAAIQATSYGVVITDLKMPDGRGEEIIAAARAGSKQTAIVIASGEATVMNGVDGVVMKPFTPDDLREGVNRAVAHRREAAATEP